MTEPASSDDVTLRPVAPDFATPQTSGMAVTSLVLGCVSFFCGFILGPLAIVFGILALRGIRRSGGQLKGEGLAIGGIVTGVIMTFVITPALLVPAIQAARQAAWRNQSMSNMKNISIALLNYAETHQGTLPAATGDGGSQLSWRVHILPYIEEQALYKQFHLDEPWDSEHNRTLINRMPPLFQNPGAGFGKGETSYLAVTGPGTAFGDGTTPPRLGDFTDGTSRTAVLVEADQGVDWTKPDDWQFFPNNSKAGLGNLRRGGFLAAFADAGIHFVDNTVPLDAVKAIMTRDGGEVAPNQAIR